MISRLLVYLLASLAWFAGIRSQGIGSRSRISYRISDVIGCSIKMAHTSILVGFTTFMTLTSNFKTIQKFSFAIRFQKKKFLLNYEENLKKTQFCHTFAKVNLQL